MEYPSLTQALKQAAKDFPNRECVSFWGRGAESGRQITYKDFYAQALSVADWLVKEAGLNKGDRVAVCLDNRPEWGEVYFGIQFAGGIAVPMDIQAEFPEISYMLKDSHCRILFASAKLPWLGQAGKDPEVPEKIIIIGSEEPKGEKESPFSRLAGRQPEPDSLPNAAPDDLASIIYTSGTTGAPKGVMLTHRNFSANVNSIKKLKLLSGRDRILSVLPLHHSYPFTVTLLTPLFTGARIVYLESLRAEELLKVLQREKITVFVAVPQLLSFLLRRIEEKINSKIGPARWLLDLAIKGGWKLQEKTGWEINRRMLSSLHSQFGPELRFFVSGGARLDPEIERVYFRLGFKVIEGYGLTETAPVATFNPLEKPKIGSAGKPLPDVELKIGEKKADGEGEILIRGPNLMQGYYQREKETAETLAEGWLRTGDSGHFDAGGYLFIKGRIKETIVLANGKNITPDEVETHYLQSKFIKEIGVLPDDLNHYLIALLVPDMDELRKSGQGNVQNIIKWQMDYYSQQLPAYRTVKEYVLSNQELPRTRLGKLQRFKLPQLFKESKQGRQDMPDIEEERLSALEQQVVQVLKQTRGRKKISSSDNLELDLGLDSLEAIELMAELESTLNVRIEEEEFARVFTVEDLLNKVGEIAERGKTGAGPEKISWKRALTSPLPRGMREKVWLEARVSVRFWKRVGAGICAAFFRTMFPLAVEGVENIPDQACLICPNHVSYLDAPIVFGALPFSVKLRLFFLGYRRYFELPIIFQLSRPLGAVPVETGNLMESMKMSSYILRNGKYLCVFPEGSRSVSGEIQEFKKGIGIISRELNVPVVPAYIHGAHEAWNPNRRFPRPHSLRIIFGRAGSPDEFIRLGREQLPEADDYKALSLGVEIEVRRLRERVFKK